MTTQELYIKERNLSYKQNIDSFFIGQNLKSCLGNNCIITDKTANSISVKIINKTKLGISYTDWYDMDSFNKRFKA